MNLCFHRTEIHWMCDDAIVAGSYALSHWECKESIGIFPTKQMVIQTVKHTCICQLLQN